MNSEIDLSTIPLDTGMPLVAESDKRARELVYVPTRQHRSASAVLIGALCRAVVAAGFVSGIAYFFADAFKIIPDKTTLSSIIVPAMLFSLAISVFAYGRRFAFVGVLVCIGAVFGELISFSLDIPGFVTDSVTAIHNAVIQRFIESGQTGLRTLLIEAGEDIAYGEGELYGGGMMLFVLLLSVLFVPAIVKRCRVIYLVPMTALFTVPLFLYNIMRANWGFALFVSAAAGTLSLWLYDRRYTSVTKKKRLVGENEVMPDPMEGIEPTGTKRDKKRRIKKSRAEKAKKSKKGSAADAMRLESPKARRKRIKNEKKQRRELRKAEKVEKKAWKRSYRRSQILDSDTARASYAFGGITGLFTFVLASIAIFLPANFVETSDPGIPYISDVMSDVRKYVTSFLSSDVIDLNGTQSMGGDSNAWSEGPRSTEALYPEYSDIVIADVRAPYNLPVYLRTWIGTRYEDDKWYSATFDEVDDYDDRFGKDFTPEIITENFYDVMYPMYSRYSLSTGYRDNSTRGFITERVSLRRLLGNSSMLFMPSFASPSKGLMAYGSIDRSRMPYNIYFDGVWTSRFFFEGASYTTESLVTTMRNANLGNVFADEIKEYSATIALIRSGEPDTMIGKGEEDIERYIYTAERKMSEETGVELPSVSMLRRYITQMTDEERAEILVNAELEERYREYVKETYLGTDDDNDEIREVVRQILSSYYIGSDNGDEKHDYLSIFESLFGSGDRAGYDRYHAVIMMLVEYLNNNYTYTKTRPEPTPEVTDTTGITDTEPDGTDDWIEPESGSVDTDTDSEPVEEPDPSAVLRFLTETKTGYCVQFASSLTLMLRSIGIPARYCEGYLANKFESDSNPGTQTAMRYRSEVLDSDAHAWVEVYYEGLGWVQYEATPAMHDDMYGSLTIAPSDEMVINPLPGQNSGLVHPDDIDKDTGDTDDIPSDELEPDGSERIVKIIMIAAAAVGVLILIFIIVYLLVLRHRGRESCRRRRELIERGENLDTPLTDEEIRRDAHSIDLGIYDLYTALGLPPKIGELSEEYAQRLTPAVGKASRFPIAKVLGYISGEEFGHSLTREELSELARYYGELTKNVYIGLSGKDKIYLRYIKRVV